MIKYFNFLLKFIFIVLISCTTPGNMGKSNFTSDEGFKVHLIENRLELIPFEKDSIEVVIIRSDKFKNKSVEISIPVVPPGLWHKVRSVNKDTLNMIFMADDDLRENSVNLVIRGSGGNLTKGTVLKINVNN